MKNIATKAADYTATANDFYLLADADTAAFAVTLISAVGNAGKEMVIKKVDTSANAVSVASAVGEAIDGMVGSYELASQWQYLKLVSDSAGW